VAILTLGVQPGATQIFGKITDKLKHVTDPISLPGLLNGDPITTSLSDVVREVPYLDRYVPDNFRPVSSLPRAPRGGWLLRPGAYSYWTESYCLHAGTRGPRSGGDGYAMAPLKGPMAEPIHAILVNSASHPDIPQQRIQALIWAILARAKFENLSNQQKTDAAQLLTPAQLALLNRTGLDILPGDALNRAIGSAPPAVQTVLRAEAQMRDLFSRGASYAELERVAVLPPDPNGPSGPIPRGRWSYHSAGAFVSYLPNTYRQTMVRFLVPGPVGIETDSLGRITALTDPPTSRVLRLTYADTPAQPYAGAPEVQVYAISNVHFERLDPTVKERPKVAADWSGANSVLVGVPSNRRAQDTPLRWQYETAQSVAASTNRLMGALGNPPGAAAKAALLANLVHLEAALEVMLSRDPNQGWGKLTQVDFVMDAWQYVFCQAAGARRVRSAGHSSGGSGIALAGLARAGFSPLPVFGTGLLAMQTGAIAPGTSGYDDDNQPLDPGDSLPMPGLISAQRLAIGQRMNPYTGLPCTPSDSWDICPCDPDVYGYGVCNSFPLAHRFGTVAGTPPPSHPPVRPPGYWGTENH
jgi:hypothetical protein